jgi:hypothetical protein
MKDFWQTKLDLPKVKDYIKQQVELHGHLGMTRKIAKESYNRLKADEIWVNDLYQVNIARGDNVPNNMFGVPMIHLSVKRRDKKPIHDWRHMQTIKDSLVGPEHEGFELYPSATRLVDTANQYHIWVFEDAEHRMPIGWTTRAVDYNPPENSGVTQRPLDEEEFDFENAIETGPGDNVIEAVTREEVDEDHAQAMMAADGVVDIDMILKAQAIMDGADVPDTDRIVQLIDPDTGELLSSDVSPERIREVIQKFVDEEASHD